MSRCFPSAIFAALVLIAATVAFGQNPAGTAAEAKAMLERAIAALKGDKTKALAAFNDPKGPFRDRDLYVFCADLAGNIDAHPDHSLIGGPIKAFIDADGKQLGIAIMAAAVEGKITEVEYKFPRVGTMVPVQKVSFVSRVADQVCGVGYYK
jgi:hypothetical protein